MLEKNWSSLKSRIENRNNRKKLMKPVSLKNDTYTYRVTAACLLKEMKKVSKPEQIFLRSQNNLKLNSNTSTEQRKQVFHLTNNKV